jgi:hypothetical protein
VVDTQGPVIFTRNGKPVAVLLAPADDDDLEQLVLARSARFQASFDPSRQSLEAGKGWMSDGFWKAAKRPALKRSS